MHIKSQKVFQGMRSSAVLVGWLGVALTLVSYTSGFSHGANPSACTDMKPRHIRAQPHNPHNNHITLHTDRASYLPGDWVPVVVRSSRNFMGFLIQARRVTDDHITGSFVVAPPGSKLLSCLEEGDTVTHSDKSLKRNLSFVWRAPDHPSGDIRFFITVVQSYFIYWARIESPIVHDQTHRNFTSADTTEGDITQTDPTTTTAFAVTHKEVQYLTPRPILNKHPTQDVGKKETGKFTSGAPLIGQRDAPGLLNNRTQEPSVIPGKEENSSQTQLAEELPEHQTQERTESHSANGVIQPCRNCGEDGHASTMSSSVEDSLSAATPPPTTHSSPVQEDLNQQGISMVAGKPSPAPRQSGTDVVTHRLLAHFLQQTEKWGSREQKGVVARNASAGGETGPAGKNGAPGQGGKGPRNGPQLDAAELGILLGCSAALGMALAAGLRYLHAQHCHKRTEVSFSEQGSNIIHVQESGELVQVRKIRENSFVLVQAEYNVITPPGK
ncbi:reelin domain-containing protein 1-like [Polyodon spathula]|uniref:reelin domain-containing protein 1-like n=1 Tax=Polyodon spathula TaxID=7913 RepID=UPI001B7DF7CC|nr:reelin domain-containing protein 1-like [Polyodon spathula]